MTANPVAAEYEKECVACGSRQFTYYFVYGPPRPRFRCANCGKFHQATDCECPQEEWCEHLPLPDQSTEVPAPGS